MEALSKEAEKAFPQRPTKVLGLQWAVPDPSKARGTPEEVRAEYERAYQSLTHHIRDLVHAILGDGQASSGQEAGSRI
jgi:protein-tyrosine-phosphatase